MPGINQEKRKAAGEEKDRPMSPLGFVKDGVNMNYYDDKKLQDAVTPFIVENIERLIGDGFKRDRIRRPHFKWDPRVIKTLVDVAWPATLQFVIQSGSWIIVGRLVAETGSTEAVAGYQVAMRNIVFFILPAWGLSNAAAALVGQNLGAGEPGRAEKSAMLTMKYNAMFMAAVMLIFLFLATPIMNIFTKEPAVHEYGVLALQIIGAGYIFYGIGMVMIQSLNGAGDTKAPTWINFAGFWLFQIPLAYTLAKGFNLGPVGAFIAIPVAETAIAIAAYIIFRKGRWKTIKV
ncbi:MATE domain protein [Ostertagia ostertagi]